MENKNDKILVWQTFYNFYFDIYFKYSLKNIIAINFLSRRINIVISINNENFTFSVWNLIYTYY